MMLTAMTGGSKQFRLSLRPSTVKGSLGVLPIGTMTALKFDPLEDTYAPSPGYPSRPSRDGPADHQSGEVEVLLRPRSCDVRAPITAFPWLIPDTIVSAGSYLRILDIGPYWPILANDAKSEPAGGLSLLASFIDICKTNLHALRHLSLAVDLLYYRNRPSDRDVAISSQDWNGALDRLELTIKWDSSAICLPYFAIARNLACLCQPSTLVIAEVLDYDLDEDRSDHWWVSRESSDWTWVEADLGDLIHWLLQ